MINVGFLLPNNKVVIGLNVDAHGKCATLVESCGVTVNILLSILTKSLCLQLIG